jgi:TRAP-type C4-dicarboxylate transport system permease large subunit
MLTLSIFAVLLVFIVLNVPIAVAMGLTAIIFFIGLGNASLLTMLPQRMCLFAVSSFSNVSIGPLSREVLPFLLGIFLVTVLIAYVPQISTFLPNLLMGR